MNPRLALVVPGLSIGGGVTSVAGFIKDAALRSGRYDLDVISLSMDRRDHCSLLLARPASWLSGVRVQRFEWEGLPSNHVGAIWGDFEFQRYRPRKPLRDLLEHCDLIQVVCGSAAWANAVLGLSKPVALQVATRACIERSQVIADAHGFTGWWRQAMTTITNRLDDRALRHVDAIQVENAWMLEYARSVNAGRAVDLRFAPPGVSTQLFRPMARRLDSREQYILCVGRLSDPRKNIALLLHAYALMPQSARRDSHIVLAGASPPPSSFWQCAKQLGVSDRVSYVARPSQPDLVRLYQGASVFALPSSEEGLGIVILEAMACGVPVVSTRSGGPDGIIADGIDGFLVPLDDALTMSRRLASLLTDRGRNIAMGSHARQRIEVHYDTRVTGAAFVDIWDGLLNQR